MTSGRAARILHHNAQREASNEAYATRPYGVVLVNTNPEKDQITFDGPRSGRTIPITHPYLGPNSWIRVMPERTTRMIVNSRVDGGEPYVSAYLAENSSQSRLTATYDDSQFYYRRLREGEISLASPGIAEQHLAQGGTMSLRAGPLTHVMSVEGLDIVSKAPTVITRSLDHFYGTVSSEVRFGVVKRFNESDSTQDKFIKVTPTNTEGSVFAKEYLRNIQSKASPFTLVDHREGHVISDSGEEETSSVTGKKLRSITRWGSATSQDTVAEVDEEGNVSVAIPSDSSYGLSINVEQTDITIVLGRDEVHNVGRNVLYDVDSTVSFESTDFLAEPSNSFSVDSGVTAEISSPLIKLTADTSFSATSGGSAVLGGSSIALASSSISMGPGADSPTGAIGALPVLRLRPEFSSVLTPLNALVSSQLATVSGFSATPYAGTIPVFTALINYIVQLHSELQNSSSSSLTVV
tara:strand:+ start:243 stop:1640 length:1398 start_codon:yes stop_codon:yes gene_type:complete